MALEEQGKAGKSNRLLALSLSKEQNKRGSRTKHQTGHSQNSWKHKQNHSLSLMKRENHPQDLFVICRKVGVGWKVHPFCTHKW